MGLGLPLLGRLTIAQLGGVLAHEFGHYWGGDTALGPWIYKTRAALERTLRNLAGHSRLLLQPFEWYGALFLGVTQAVSRAQEYSADALAARIVGSEPLITGLKVVHGTGAAFDPYWREEYLPVLQQGFRPPFQEGFQSFVAIDDVAQAVAALVEQELAAPQSDPYDTHPPLADRIAALGKETVVEGWANGELAITLVDDLSGLERRLIGSVVGDTLAAKLRAVSWRDVPKLLWAPVWKHLVHRHAQRLKGVKPSTLIELLYHPASLAVALELAARPDVATPQQVSDANAIFGAALATALLSRGWDVTGGMGEHVRLRQGTEEILPFDTWPRIADGRLTREDWRSQCDRTGIADLDLGAVA